MCRCNKTVKTGTYDNTVTVSRPEHMIGRYGEGSNNQVNISVDTCIVDEVKELWARGIRTTGCCCGHNKQLAYIGAIPDDIEKMKAMGYTVQPNPCRPGDEDTFNVKTRYEV